MSFKYIALLAIGLFCLAPIGSLKAADMAAYSTSQTGNRTHVVSKGQTMYSIATMYNVTVQQMYELNPSAVNGIKEGQTLLLPSNCVLLRKIEKKETLYSVAQEYNLTEQDLISANPGLSPDNFMKGAVIVIPARHQDTDNYIHHQVQPKETLYGISKQYNVSIDAITAANPNLKNGLATGTTVLIPKQTGSSEPAGDLLVNSNNKKHIRIGIFLPFLNKSDAQQVRFLEYYQGFLLAVRDLKSKGVNIDVYAFDINSEAKLQGLLESSDIQALDLIIGGVTSKQVAILKDYTQKMGIKYVEPFPSKTTGMEGDNVFEVNTSSDYMEAEVIQYFCKNHSDDNVIVLSKKDANKLTFTDKLSKKLLETGNRTQNLTMSLDLVKNLSPMLQSNKLNVIVPNSSSRETLSSIIAVLKTIHETSPNIKIAIFGYPDWQAYSQFTSDLQFFGATIYTPFYISDTNGMNTFSSEFRKWYGKDLLNTFPKFGLCGYDTGIYFMTAINKYGGDLSNNISKLNSTGLQMPFSFERQDTGGYINKGFYILNFKSTGIEKISYNK